MWNHLCTFLDWEEALMGTNTQAQTEDTDACWKYLPGYISSKKQQ